ncbi:MAG: alpha/beta hydrolase family protein [Candidatus Xenobiia bacterium LiM19]
MNKHVLMKRSLCFLLSMLAAFWITGTAFAQQNYQKPPKAVLDVLNAPLPPSLFLSPRRDSIVFADLVRYPSISDLAEPMLRLAGVRINPRTNSERGYIYYWTGLSVKKFPDGAETKIALPAGVSHIVEPRWNATGTMLAFNNETSQGVNLLVLDIAARKARQIGGVRLNPILGNSAQWMPDNRTMLVKLIPEDRGAPPEPPAVPPGPKILESSQVASASSTYEARDVLKSPHDADLFDYYATSQLALVDIQSGKITLLGKPAVFGKVVRAPGGSCILVERIHRPYSYLCAYNRFPRESEVWTTSGELVEVIVSQPLAEQVPIGGVITGPRDISWRPTAPSTLIWIEAQDGGNPNTKVPFRDLVMQKPIGGKVSELWRSEQRFGSLSWVEKSGLVFASDFDRDRRWKRMYFLNADDSSVSPRLIWELSADDKYNDPGYFVQHLMPTGFYAVESQGGCVCLSGYGASPEGERPFLDRLSLQSFKKERLFRSDRESYEIFAAWADLAAGTFITRRESPIDPPNYLLRTLAKSPITGASAGEASWRSTATAVTKFPDPVPQIRGITKRLVTYKRADGVPLSFMLYLPPGYKPGTRLPTVLWAYPLDYVEKGVAGQVEGSSRQFTTFSGSSELFFLLQGYAVLADAAMPVVGPRENAYDTFVDQIVANAKAAIDKAVELGVTDPERVGAGGHSHGALMTADLLAYSDLFRAGIARSGAYNHTMRPFGFQNESRTLWQARDSYIKLSPVLQADKINKPLLLIHGELDENPGTVPMQSEKLYEAMRGIGGNVRLVMLPYEGHGYQAVESIEHVLYEMITWFDKYVKNAPPRAKK